MSYSFSLRAASIVALCAAAAAKFDQEVIATQPVHKADRDAALVNLKTHAELVGEPAEGQDLTASMHGSVWAELDPDTGAVKKVLNAGSGCSVGFAPKA